MKRIDMIENQNQTTKFGSVRQDSYLFLTDLDGTILNEKKQVTPKTEKALTEFVRRGNTFAICTGRDMNSARSVYQGLGLSLPGSFVVAYNGGQIYSVDLDETIFRIGIEKEMVAELFAMAREYGVHIHTYNDRFILTPEYNECMDFYRRVIKTPVIVSEKIMEFVEVPPCKMICIELHDHEKQERFRKAVLERFGDTLDLMYSNAYYLELIPKESGKGSALLRLRDLLGIRPDHTMAAGDADNDISMIKAAGIGIAMKNAADTVKAAADVVTEEDNDHDGLAPILWSVMNS